MKKSILYFSGILIALVSLTLFFTTGCQRELQDPGGTNPPPVNPGPVINDNITVVASVRGIVVDENDIPVEAAVVNSGTNSTTTDRYGTFRFNNINLSKANGYVKVTKTGYFTGSRTFISTAGRTHTIRIKLLPKTNAGNFNSSAGGTINISGGGKLTMPANAISDASGNAYSGTVNVAMTWINPTSPDLASIVPGDLRGITTDGQERGLETFGMLGVELTGSTGQALKVATGKQAELTFPIPASLQSNAPATIDLWNFDEATGRWKQEGTATKSGSNYIANVSHFSFWNCDAPFPVVDVCMTLVSAPDNIPLNNTQVRIKRPNGSYGHGRTDSSGSLCGKIPKNEALVLEVISQCNTVIYSQNIGPFSGNANLGTVAVTVPDINSLTITGTVLTCSNTNVVNGAVMVYTGNGNSYVAPVTNGIFNLTVIRCGVDPLNFSILPVDYTALQQGNPTSGMGTTGVVNVGSLQACGTSSLEFIEFLVDGSPHTYASPPDAINIMDSTGGGGNNNVSFFAQKNTPTTPPNTGFSMIRFGSDGSTGVKPLQLCRVFIAPGAGGLSEQIVTPNPTVNITAFGPVGTGFIEGNFTVQMNFGGTVKNVVCTFRVRRS